MWFVVSCLFLLLFWICICVLLCMYDISGKRGFLALAMLPVTIISFIMCVIQWIVDGWYFDGRENIRNKRR